MEKLQGRDAIITECKKNCSNNNTPEIKSLTLPDHLILEQILPRLPVKSLIRFKSVSKYWLCTFSSPEFAKSHLNFSSSSPIFLIEFNYVKKQSPELYFLHYNESDCTVKSCVRSVLGHVYNCHSTLRNGIVGSCNGLVCSSVEYPIHILLWNPATHHRRKIDLPILENFGCFTSRYFGVCHFGYASCIDDYQIFVTCNKWNSQFTGCELVGFYVFSLSSGSWKRIDYCMSGKKVVECKQVIIIDDTIYFTMGTADEIWKKGKRIAGYNILTEEITEFPTLDWLHSDCSYLLSSIKGSLSLLCQMINGDFYVWTMKKHGDWDSWEKWMSLDLKNRRVLALSDTGKCLIERTVKTKKRQRKQRLEQLQIVDISKGALQLLQGGSIGLDKGDYFSQSQCYVESLVSPFPNAKDDEFK